MQFHRLPEATHPAVRLRPLRVGDIEAWAGYLNLPQVYQHTSWNHPSAAELAPYVGNESDTDAGALLRLAIAAREDDRLVGTIGFHTVSGPNRSAELAYELHPGVWGRGIASCLVRDVVAWGHGHAGLVRIQATVLASNGASIRVLERTGFVREGLLRCYRMVRGTPGDFWMYAHIGAAA